MQSLKQFIGAVRGLSKPASPQHWLRYARGLNRGSGWNASMFLWSLVGVMLFVNFGLGRHWGIHWLEKFNLTASITWGMVALVAMVVSCAKGFRGCMRLGPWGMTRPRWWFELARMGLHAATIGFAGLCMAVFIPEPWRLVFSDLLTGLLILGSAGGGLLLVASLVGYFLVFATGRPRTGQAYDCVHYYLGVWGPIAMMTLGAISWPAGRHAMDAWFAVLCIVLGAVWALLALRSLVHRYSDREGRKGNSRRPDDPSEWRMAIRE